jgi:TonB-dependent SusC/RagA subfamily outer membrane receptor
MITSWMLQSVAVAALLALSAWAADGLLSLYRLPRRWVWVAGCVLAVTLPVLALLTPGAPAASETVAVSVASVDASASVTPPAQVAPSPFTAARDVVASGIAAVAADVRVSRVLVTAWLLVAGVLTCLLVATMMRFARARRSWQQRIVADTPVLVTSDAGPAVIGVIRPSIIIPSWLLSADPVHQRMVVQHEREHVRRGDHALLAGAATVAALLPWNLPLQWMLRRLRTAVEIDCDRRVLAAGTPAREYGAMLIDIAARSHRLPLAVALTGGETDLERRIRAMSWKRPRFRSVRAAAGALGAAALVLVACEVDLMDPALQESTVGDVVDSAVMADPGFAVLAAQARYVLDGREVTLDEIRDLDMDAIASAEVLKAGMSEFGVPEVRMLTHAGAAALREAAESARAAAEADRAAPETGRRAAAEQQTPATARGAAAEDRIRAVVAADQANPEAVVARVAELRALRQVRLEGRLAPDSAGLHAEFRVERITPELQLRPQAANAPLYIVDGIVVSNALMNLDALDIESIEIVKGAAAVQLYGSRAANGVINITTKSR